MASPAGSERTFDASEDELPSHILAQLAVSWLALARNLHSPVAMIATSLNYSTDVLELFLPLTLVWLSPCFFPMFASNAFCVEQMLYRLGKFCVP